MTESLVNIDELLVGLMLINAEIVGKAKQNNVGVLLDKNYREIYEFIVKYYNQYNSLPTRNVVYQKFGVLLPERIELSSDYLIDELKNRQLYNIMSAGVYSVVGKLKEKNPQEAYRLLEDLVSDIRQTNIIKTNVVDIMTLKQQVIDAYKKAKDGSIGIETPWPSINNITLGWQDGEIYGVFGRTSKGKSFLLIIIAHFAWQQGKKVLFVSPEMTQLAIARRFYSIALKIPYGQLRRGQLGDFVEENFYTQLNNLSGVPLYLLAEGKVNIGTVEAAIEQIEPDLILLDGIYLINCPGDNRIERMATMADILKDYSRRYKRPIIYSSQFNRTVSQSATRVEITSIALSDSLSWSSDVCFGLLQDAGLKALKQMRIVPMKVREAEELDEIIISWDFHNLDFREIGDSDGNSEFGGFE